MVFPWVTFGLVALLLMLTGAGLPWFTRPNILFGVAFDVLDLRKDATATGLKRRYVTWCGGLMVVIWGGAAVIAASINTPRAVTISLMIATPLYLVGTFVLQMMCHRQSMAYHERRVLPSATSRVSVNLSELARQKILSPAWALMLLPLVGLAYLIHTPLLTLVANATVAFVVGVTFIFGRRSAASVRGNAKAASGVAEGRNAVLIYAMGVAVCAQAFIILTAVRPDWTNLLALVFSVMTLGTLIFLIVFWLRQAHSGPVKGPIVDDNAHWLFGSIYFNSADSAVFVEKRLGIGVTLNLARPVAWLFLLVIFAVVGLLVAFQY